MTTQFNSFDASKFGAFKASRFGDARNRMRECKPQIIGQFVTNSRDPLRACWDLSEFLGPGIYDCIPAFWRLIERGACFPRQYPWYGAGCVGRDGELIGLPPEFCTNQVYDGYMELQIGCPSYDPSPPDSIQWPGSCQNSTLIHAFPCASDPGATAGVPSVSVHLDKNDAR